MSIDRGDVDLAVAEPDAAVGRPATELLGWHRHLVLVVPQLRARLGVEGGHGGHGLGQVEHAVGDERRRLEGRRLAGLVDPGRRQLGHVAGVDLVQRREAVGRIGAAVHQPLGLVGSGVEQALVRDPGGAHGVREEQEADGEQNGVAAAHLGPRAKQACGLYADAGGSPIPRQGGEATRRPSRIGAFAYWPGSMSNTPAFAVNSFSGLSACRCAQVEQTAVGVLTNLED